MPWARSARASSAVFSARAATSSPGTVGLSRLTKFSVPLESLATVLPPTVSWISRRPESRCTPP